MKEKNILEKIKESKKYIKGKIKLNPKTAVICGSGLSNIKDIIKQETVIPYSKIPHFKQSTVEGHTGELVVGKLNSKDVILMNGRFHYYEGYTMQEITYPVRVMKSLGIETLIITCAVGAINPKYNVGDIVVIKDHINFMCNNPLIGKHYNEFGNRFPDMTNIYNKDIGKQILKTAKNNKIKVHEGIYFAVSGPSYETPAEVNAYRILGGDVVGMSLVPESIVANQMNMKVTALTYISNKASGLTKKSLTHSEVLQAGKTAAVSMEKIIKNIVKEL
ncbi:MAG: purine-nucleoside phosphorylase [Endomicrobiaceae bacterium]|nr:purine-nucleoside phosphorylase [Endomicrobiaceae bacterium]